MTRGPVNTEAILVAYLASSDAEECNALGLGAAGTGTKLPEDLGTRDRFLKVYRYPGGGGVDPETHRLDLARVQLDAYGRTKALAFELGQAALADVLGLAGRTVNPYGFVSHVAVTLGLGWQPDPETDQPRYLAAIDVIAHRLD